MKDDIIDLIIDLADYYGKTLSPRQTVFWKRKLRGISYAQVERTCDACMENEKYMPTPGKFLERSRRLPDAQQQGPTFTPTFCDQCGYEGLIFFSYVTNGVKYQAVGRCDACNNWRQHYGDGPVSRGERTPPPLPAFINRERIRQNGWQLEGFSKWMPDKAALDWQKQKDLRQLVGRVGK